ncbi:MAG: PhzF family phenazine biosynthesis protein, partial [Desulfovibrionaceae bacterium]|nr:PhzF family phenazine biosynthesis protein [Desulfovibrionaceae bacterium]
MRYYIVDAFTDRVFTGNPAAVLVLDEPLPEALIQSVAVENNLSETAFVLRESDAWRLRWFTPGGEIDLCGHATLASAFVLLTMIVPDRQRVEFGTVSGTLAVQRRGDLYEMDFPSFPLQTVPVTDEMEAAFGIRPAEAWLGRDLVCVFDGPEMVEQTRVSEKELLKLPGLLAHITAAGTGAYDCVSRSFGPKLSVSEDPVCGSGHCHIAPFWAERLGRQEIVARQASARGGTLYCRVHGDRTCLA